MPAPEITVHVPGDYVWTMTGGQVAAWRVAEDGTLAAVAVDAALSDLVSHRERQEVERWRREAERWRDTAEVATAGRPTPDQVAARRDRIVAFLGEGPQTFTELRERSKVTRHQLRHDLDQLQEEGRVVAVPRDGAPDLFAVPAG
jgi:predicted Rossmann fold nucleotide-binding protein DprA/Smf involved in DNA uptake